MDQRIWPTPNPRMARHMFIQLLYRITFIMHVLSGDGMRDEIRQDIIVHMHVQLVKADKLLDRLWKHLTV